MEILYDRNDGDFRRGTFRVRGDVIEVFPTYDDDAYRIELWGDEVESLSQIDPLLGQVKQTYMRLPIYPEDALRDVGGDRRWTPWTASATSWSGGARSLRSRASSSRRSACSSAPCSISK